MPAADLVLGQVSIVNFNFKLLLFDCSMDFTWLADWILFLTLPVVREDVHVATNRGTILAPMAQYRYTTVSPVLGDRYLCACI